MTDRGQAVWRTTYREGMVEILARLAIALALAMVFAPVMRTVAIEINRSAASVWPFSIEHCHVRATPGCNPTQGMFTAGEPIALGHSSR